MRWGVRVNGGQWLAAGVRHVGPTYLLWTHILKGGNLVPTRPRACLGHSDIGQRSRFTDQWFPLQNTDTGPRLDPGVAARPRSTSRVRNPEAQSGATAQLPTAQLPHPRCSSCCLGGQDKWPAVLLDLSVEWFRRSMVKRPIWNEVGEWGHPLFCLMVWSLQTRPHSRQLPRGAPARCTPWSDLFLSSTEPQGGAANEVPC